MQQNEEDIANMKKNGNMQQINNEKQRVLNYSNMNNGKQKTLKTTSQ